MQISAIPPLPSTTPFPTAGGAPTDPEPGEGKQAAKSQDAASVSATSAEAEAKKVFTPAPPLRPNVQDVVDIDRALIALRAL